MYTDGTRAAGHHRFLQHNTPCQCHHCVHYEPPFPPHHGGPGYRPTPTQADHPSLDRRRDIQAPRLKDVGGRAFAVDRAERSGHRSPQRRPVFAGPGPYSQPDDLSQNYPWDLNPAQWNCPPEPGARHYPPVREQCGCVAWGDARVRPFNTGQPPQPLPPTQVRGQAHRHRRTVKYVSEEEEKEEGGWGCAAEHYHLEPHTHGPQAGHLHMPNGHCGPRPVCYEGVEERDGHQDRSRLKGGSEEGCNGRGASHKGFFSTEVPQKHLNQSRRKGPCVPPPGTSSHEPLKPAANSHHQRQGSDVAKQKGRQDSVRDQIRQVVTDLEDVLGGLKQVHVEMKEVVQQIDRLTANIDLGEGGPSITQGGPSNFHGPSHPGDLSMALVPNHKPGPLQVSQHIDEDCIILRTSSPSPVHTASVVKTSRVAPASHSKDINHGVNGHPPHLYLPRDSNHVGHTHPEPPPPRTLDPKVIIGNSTSSSRTQKPPPYPQNGRCGKGPYPPPNPVRTPAYPGRGGRQSTSMV
uniref:uncharacterized protein n=1 Tax=Centroberyx gerrardi TaxID=166262 RepID=UPI003AACF99C